MSCLQAGDPAEGTEPEDEDTDAEVSSHNKAMILCYLIITCFYEWNIFLLCLEEDK